MDPSLLLCGLQVFSARRSRELPGLPGDITRAGSQHGKRPATQRGVAQFQVIPSEGRMLCPFHSGGVPGSKVPREHSSLWPSRVISGPAVCPTEQMGAGEAGVGERTGKQAAVAEGTQAGVGGPGNKDRSARLHAPLGCRSLPPVPREQRQHLTSPLERSHRCYTLRSRQVTNGERTHCTGKRNKISVPSCEI